jgi:hypothetical protein
MLRLGFLPVLSIITFLCFFPIQLLCVQLCDIDKCKLLGTHCCVIYLMHY